MEGDLASVLILCWTGGSDSINLLRIAGEWGKPVYWSILMGVGLSEPFIDGNHRKEELQIIQISLNSTDLLFSPLNSMI